MPVSREDTLKKYAGRLHRAHADKSDVRIYDYVETKHVQLARMWAKRRKGHAAMGYRVIAEPASDTDRPLNPLLVT